VVNNQCLRRAQNKNRAGSGEESANAYFVCNLDFQRRVHALLSVSRAAFGR
jgi:hypothetical protein